MSASYTFTENPELLDSAVLVEESIVWDQSNGEDQTYIDNSHTILTDTIDESYVTADGDDNTTQYFSILDPSILSEMNISAENPKIADADDMTAFQLNEEQLMLDTTNVNGQDVLLYNVPNDGLYGIQVAEDADGNLQKYQFKIRQNEHGQLEAITETIQVLPMDSDEIQTDGVQMQEQMDTVLTHNPQPIVSMLVKQEYAQEEILGGQMNEIQPDNEDAESELHVDEEGEEQHIRFENESSEEVVDSKADIIEHKYNIIHKQEAFEENLQQHHGEIVDDTEYFENEPTEEINDEENEEPENIYLNESTEFEVDAANAAIEEETGTETHYEQVFIEENHVLQSATSEVDQTYHTEEDESSQDTSQSALSINENESDNEDYQIVEGMHITGDADVENEMMQVEDTHVFPSFQSVPLKQQVVKTQLATVEPKYLKTLIGNVALKELRANCNSNGSNKSFGNYFIIKHPEKENVATVQQLHTGIKLQRSNPRSILKSSFVTAVEPRNEAKTLYEEKIDKRFARSKEATQARLLHNYIAKTTILQAPVRQERLPRKQTIKPVNRQDEEIIVQEVVVCSNGFIETSEDGVLKNKELLKPTEFLNISDSDDDYDPKHGHKQKKNKRKRKARVEIVISDSENPESDDDSVIQIGSDDSESDDKSKSEEEGVKKRGRGRPRKNIHADVGVNSLKRKRGRPPKKAKSDSEMSTRVSEDELEQIRKEVESHVMETRNNAALQRRAKQDENDLLKNEAKCTKCAKTFPSQNSLRTHMQYHNFRESSIRNAKSTEPPKTSQHRCSDCNQTFKNVILLNRHLKDHEKLGCKICRRIFPDIFKLAAHKRMHIKRQLARSTNTVLITPKKITTPAQKQLKCDVCGAIFVSTSKLGLHLKIHKRFACATCSEVFLSKVMLDIHMRERCVKIRSPANRRLTFKNKGLSFQKSGDTSTVNPKKGVFETFVCDVCRLVFSTHTGLFKHKVNKHGSKSISKDTKLTRIVPSNSKTKSGNVKNKLL